MNTFLDLLIVVVLSLLAVGALAMILMFLVKKEKVRKISFWIVALLGIYIGSVGVRIMGLGFLGQAMLAVLMGLVSIGAIVLERLSKGSEKKFLIARIMSCVALVVGMFNAFVY